MKRFKHQNILFQRKLHLSLTLCVKCFTGVEHFKYIILYVKTIEMTNRTNKFQKIDQLRSNRICLN